jgi:hypothetical protein
MWADRFLEDVRAEHDILADATQRAENMHQIRHERRLNKAERRALENPTIPPDDPRRNDMSSSKLVSSSTEDSDFH